MIGGIHGRILHIDLTTGATRVETPPEELYRLLVGGRALVAYLLLRDLPPRTDPSARPTASSSPPASCRARICPVRGGTAWAASRR